MKATVVSRPWLEAIRRCPVFSSMKQPVPYVFLASPGRQRWPAVGVGLCWGVGWEGWEG